MRPLGLYVHIPFCKQKCAYCDFISWANRTESVDRYIDAVCEEIACRAPKYARPAVDSVFFGGGTPSLLSGEQFTRLADALRARFDILPDAEWTVECNPGALTADFVQAMVEAQVNRVSMGMQAAQDHLLKTLGRIHRYEDVKAAVALLRQAGIDNLNLDLMLGLPGQTLADIEESVHLALDLRPTHISAYALIVEEGTKLHRMVEEGALSLPGDELDRLMYGRCRDMLRERGFQQYEISNFALPDYECRHNVNCWQRQNYLGFGCAAHSFYGHERWFNASTLDYPRAAVSENRTEIDENEAMFETMMLGLRLTRGVSEQAFYARFGVPLWEVYGKALAPALKDGRLKRENGFVFLTEDGMDKMNSVLVPLL